MAWFTDIAGKTAPGSLDWREPVIISRAEIGAETVRLSQQAAPANGRRESPIIHPRAGLPGNGVAPGIRANRATS
jgi:gentisate 1,2-dioxygenase